MSTIFENGLQLGFARRYMAEDFIKWVQGAVYKVDVVTLNDILRYTKRPVGDEWRIKSLHYGYSKKETRKLKPVKTPDGYLVVLPPPGKMVQGENGYWTTIPFKKNWEEG